MAYYLDLFSPTTYEAFGCSDRSVTGFREGQLALSARIKAGDRFICYMTKLGRWIGVLEVQGPAFKDETPRFLPDDDPFVIRFKVKPLAWLDPEFTVPIRDDEVWDQLTWTRGKNKGVSSEWTGPLRGSMQRLGEHDGAFLERLLLRQQTERRRYEFDRALYDSYIAGRTRRSLRRRLASAGAIRAAGGATAAAVDGGDAVPAGDAVRVEARQSIKMQAMVASIGAKMGYGIWLPRNDKARVLAEAPELEPKTLQRLPMNYHEMVLDTIERIDVLWIDERSIVRAFEVEHTTSIYSGILRMADLLALQNNIDIKMHIVAPDERREDVLREIARPVFERLKLHEKCTYVAYSAIQDLAKQEYLDSMSDKALDRHSVRAQI
jgi:hypothetical protein